MRKQQLNLFKQKVNLCFGGSLLSGKRKSVRPLSQKKPIHLVLKATNAFLLLRNKTKIKNTLDKFSKRFGVKIYKFAVEADHIHLSVVLPNRTLYNRWIRATTSTLSQKIEGLKWKFRPFTRIGTWGRDFKSVLNYIQINSDEGDFFLEAHLRVESWYKKVAPSG